MSLGIVVTAGYLDVFVYYGILYCAVLDYTKNIGSFIKFYLAPDGGLFVMPGPPGPPIIVCKIRSG